MDFMHICGQKEAFSVFLSDGEDPHANVAGPGKLSTPSRLDRSDSLYAYMDGMPIGFWGIKSVSIAKGYCPNFF